jgi:ATP-binding cassette, subfamily C, bacterial LapB
MLPMFSMAVFDRVIPHAAFETLWALALGVTVALGVEMALRNARLKLQDAVAQGLGVGLQCEAMGRQLHARTPDLPRQSGGLIQPVNDLDTIANLSPAIIVSALVDLPFFFIMVVLIASIGGVVALAPILGTLGLVAIHAFAHHMSHRTSRAHGAIARRQHQMLIDTIAAQERIRVTNASGVFLSRFEQTADDCAFTSHEIRYWHGLAAQLSAVLVQGVVVATIVIGVFQINAAAMTIGALSACILLVNRSMMPVSIVTGLAFRLMQVLETAAPVSAMLNATLEAGGADGRSLPTRIKGDVTFADVTFTYPGEDKPALKGISFTMKPGERIGLVGKSGCGKSSLLRMIVRLNEPTEGRMKLDERDIRQYDPAMLRRCIGFMPQDSTLIDGTLQDNLVLGLAAVDPDRFERICRMTGVHDIAARHPSGFNLQVGPGGQRLSAGERQCVSLARTLMGEPDLLLLDEPTSAFDNGHEQKIVAELRQLPSSTGMVIATHRTALLAIVDRIIWIDGGRIVADGAREDIFKRHGLAA